MSSVFNLSNYNLGEAGKSGSGAVAADYENEVDLNLPGESSDTNVNGCRIGVALEGPNAGDAIFNSNDHQVFIDHETGMLVVSDRFTDSDDATLKPNFVVDLKTGVATDAYGVMYDLPDRCRFVLSDGTKVALDKIKLQDGTYGRDVMITNVAHADGQTEANGNFGAQIRYDGSGAALTYHGSNNDGKDVEAFYASGGGSDIGAYHSNVGWTGGGTHYVPNEDDGDDLDFGDDDDNMGSTMPDIFVTNVFWNPPEEGKASITAFIKDDGKIDLGAFRSYVNGRLQHDDDNTKTYRDPTDTGGVKAMNDERGGAWTICFGMDQEGILEKNDRLYLGAISLLQVHTEGGVMKGGPVVADVQPVTASGSTESSDAAASSESQSIFRDDALAYASQFTGFSSTQQTSLFGNPRDDNDDKEKESLFKPDALVSIRSA